MSEQTYIFFFFLKTNKNNSFSKKLLFILFYFLNLFIENNEQICFKKHKIVFKLHNPINFKFI